MTQFTHADTYEEAAAQYAPTEWLAQLAEEASELAQAALKYRRTLINTGLYTPVDPGIAAGNMIEEYSDVKSCIERLIGTSLLETSVASVAKSKQERFVQRHNEHRVPSPEDRIRCRMIFQTNSHEEEYALVEKICKQLQGNPDFINSEICVNMSSDREDGTTNEVHVVIFEGAKNVPEIKI